MGLGENGLNVDFMPWWQEGAKTDLIHYFGSAPNLYLSSAQAKGIPVVMTTLFTETCNRTDWQLRRQGWLTQAILRLPFGEGVKQQLTWRNYHRCAHNVVGLEAERYVLEMVYRVPREKISVVPLGLSDTFLRAGCGARREAHLICTGTITERKQSVELARLARQTKVPILFVGKPYSPNDPYWKTFEALIDQRVVKYSPHVGTEAEMIALLHVARGFVIMSRYENWCLSAHEAAACGLPLLLPDQKWSQECFGSEANYFAARGSEGDQAARLRSFYDECPNAPAPKIRLYSWREVGQKMRGLYERVLSTSR